MRTHMPKATSLHPSYTLSCGDRSSACGTAHAVPRQSMHVSGVHRPLQYPAVLLLLLST